MNREGIKIIPLWSLVILLSIGVSLFLSWLGQKGITSLNNIIDPCKHGGTYDSKTDTCDCSNSNGLFGGQYCGEHQCKNFGVLIRYSQQIRENELSLYACRCPKGPEKRWAGFLCDKCYAENQQGCTGKCDSSTLNNYGYSANLTNAVVLEGSQRQCDKICLPNGNINDCIEVDVGHNGICNACNGHGTCDNEGECVCQNGYFDSEEGIQCIKSCKDEDGNPLCGKNADCKIINGQPKCFCKEGFWGEPECDIVCPGINPITYEGVACNGHGSCYYNGQSQNISGFKNAFCACDPTYVAEGSPACEFECPHKATVQEPCSGHGTCVINDKKDGVTCNCNQGDETEAWYGKRCDCNTLYSCFGHGECNDDTGECICYNGGIQDDKPNTIAVNIFSNIENAPDTYKFNSPAHYVVFQSNTYSLFEGMILNITNNVKEMPITIKTVYENGTHYIGEFDETEAKALTTYFELGSSIQNINHLQLKFNFNWDASVQPYKGYYSGPRCLECQKNWFPPPKMQNQLEACNVYCDPNSEYIWHDDRSSRVYPFSGQGGFGCWGRGQCYYEFDSEEPNKLPQCKCQPGTDPETNCAQCTPDKYPKLQWSSKATIDFCSETCVESTCNGHGRCNPLAFSTVEEELCVCDLNTYNMDTLNATARCTKCQNDWYPENLDALGACSDFCSSELQTNMNSGCLNLIRTYSETVEDITLITSNLQEQEVPLVQRIPAPEKQRVINCLNCQAGSCSREGQCICPEGVTGVECQQQCLRHNGDVCAGHGECSQNELHLFFNPESELTQCDCNPQDQYTEETRDYYQRMGITLDPKPSKDYYGSACEYHCPTYNTEICSSRGECHPIPVEGSYRCKKTLDENNPMSCESVMAGEDMDGVFCAVTSSPWDDKAKSTYKAVSYWEPPSPGAVQCKLKSCQDDIEERDWSQYCVSMLKGLYPEELNTAMCAHNKEKDSECAGLNGHIKCSTALEDAFSRAKTCSDFESINGSIRVYDAWDVEEMGITTVVINVKKQYIGDATREMTPFLFHVTSVNNTHYEAQIEGQLLIMHRDIDNTIIIDQIGCGDTYGLKWNQPLTGASADGTGYLSYTADRCSITNCEQEQFTTNPWHNDLNVSNTVGCCGCTGGVVPTILTNALDETNKDFVVHTIQLYHDKTWCQMSNTIFEKSGALNDDCTGDNALISSYENVKDICHGYYDRVECTLDNNCVYDLSVDNQKNIKNQCNAFRNQANTCDNDPQCIYNINTGDCDPRTFCRPKKCEDTIKDVGISPFCIDITIPDWCPAEADNVDVSFKPYSKANVIFKNVDKKSIDATDINDCARQVSNLGKDMFEYSLGNCYWYNKIYDLQTEDSASTTYSINGFQEDALAAYTKQWEDQCFALTSEVTEISRVSKSQYKPSDLFFMCWNLNEKNYPFVMASTGAVRGGIKLLHEDKFKAFTESFERIKQDDKFDINDFPVSDQIEVDAKWCKNHINTRYPTGDIYSWADATKYSRTSDFSQPNYATICSDSVRSPDVCTGFNFDTSSAAKNTIFWDKVFKRQYGESWGCTTRNKEDEGSWNAGSLYYLSCYDYNKNEWVKKEDINMNDPNVRYQYLSKMTPKELESCKMTPNMDAFAWNPPDYNVISRTTSMCSNVEDATKHVLNNAIVFETLKDVEVSTPDMEFEIFANADPDATERLIYPELLYRSRLQGINLHEEDIFYLHRPGTCFGDCTLIGKAPFNVSVFDNAESAREWCDEHMECDGFTRDNSGYYPWSFIGGSYEYVEKPMHDSYIKSSSVQDDCHNFVAKDMFHPTQSVSSRYSVPDVSQSVLINDNTLEFTKKQAGAIHMDGWSDDIQLSQSSRFYVTGSNLPNNILMVEYVKVQINVDGLDSYNDKRDAEISCFNDNTCGGLIYVADKYNKYGFGSGDIYKIGTGITIIPDENGTAYFAPNLFKFNMDGNYLKINDILDRPYDVKLVWPLADFYGIIDIQLENNFGWSPKYLNKSWTIGASLFTLDGVIVIKNVKTVPLISIFPEKFDDRPLAEAYALNQYNVSDIHENVDNTFSPFSNLEAWKKINKDKKVNIFYFENTNKHSITMEELSYGNIKTISKHIKREEEQVYIEPIKVCLVNPRQIGDVIKVNESRTCSVQWDYWTTDITACKFSSTYYANGTIVITPDGIEVDGTYSIGMIEPHGNAYYGTWTEAKRDTVINVPYDTSPVVVASMTTIRDIPTISFNTEGTVALALTKNGIETFSLDIIDNFAYINKNYNLSIPKSNTGWNIIYETGTIKVNNNPGVDLRGGVIPDKVHIWNTISNSSSRVTGIETGYMNGIWSTEKAMHPGRAYAYILNDNNEYKENIHLNIDIQWTRGGWVEDNNTVSKSFTPSSQNDCIHNAMNYHWEGKGPVQYISWNNNVCTIYWDTLLTHTSTSDGFTAVLPRTQYHVSGWMYTEASTSSIRTLNVLDKSTNNILSIQMKSGRLLDNGFPTNTLIEEDTWHYWSLDVTRVVPQTKEIQIQIADNTGGTTENANDNYIGKLTSTLDTGFGTTGTLEITPMLKVDSVVINNIEWKLKYIDVESGSSYFENTNPVDYSNGIENVVINVTSYMYTTIIEIDEELYFSGTFESPYASIDGGSVEMKNSGFDGSEFRLTNVKVRNRRASSICNVKDLLFKMTDEIAIQECKFSHDCYDTLEQVNKFKTCENNLKYNIPEEITGENAKELSAELDWIAYCDYAFPHSLDYEGRGEVCEGLWLSFTVDNGEPKIIESVTPLKRTIGVMYSNCTNSNCENVTQGFSSHVNCINACREAYFVYLDDNDLEKQLFLWKQEQPMTIRVLDYEKIRCNSVYDHIGIQTGDWVPECHRVDERFPVMQCFDGRHVTGKSTSLGSGTTLNECREILKRSGKTPTMVEIGSGECVPMFNTEGMPDDLTPEPGIQTCFIRYGGIPSITKSVDTFTVPDCNNYPYDNKFYTACFEKTQQYTVACSDTCINRLRTEISDKDCSKVENMRDIKRLSGNECATTACQQNLDAMIPKQFCAYQEQYHDIQPVEIETKHSLLIPDLQTTSCTDQCISHLERSINYEEWEEWCLNYASGDILGYCSRTDCNCEAGYDGTQCELKCPMGSSDGEDATCSGTNGFCIPRDASDIFEDKSRQDAAGEYDSEGITNYPPWQTGPSTVQGICECTVGTGEACELQCTNNNNGTYGPSHLNQFGICDTYLAITKPLPPCSRYNSMGLTDNGDLVSPNSTTYDRARILHPERLFFCEEQDMIEGASLTAYDDSVGLSTSEIKYSYIGVANSTGYIDLEYNITFEQHAKDATRIFQKICFPSPNDDLLTFDVVKDTNKKYTQKPTFIPSNWVYEKIINALPPFDAIDIDTGSLWKSSLTTDWIETRLSNQTSYYDTFINSISDTTVIECIWETMKRYSETNGMFYMKNASECYLQNATKSLNKEEWLKGESPNTEVLSKISDTSVYSYFIDVEDIPYNLRNINRPTASKSHGKLSSTPIKASDSVILWVEENQPGATSVSIKASNDNGVTSSHVIEYGPKPFNRKSPGLVKINDNTILMFGGRLVFLQSEDEDGNVVTGFEDSNELFRIDIETFDFANQHIVTVSYSEPEIRGDIPDARANPVMAFNAEKNMVYLFGGNKVQYDAFGVVSNYATHETMYVLDISQQTGIVLGETKRTEWLWQVLKSIEYNKYNPLSMVRLEAWMDVDTLLTETLVCDNECNIAVNVCENCVQEGSALTPVEFNCDLKIQNMGASANEYIVSVIFGDESRPIAKWELPMKNDDIWKSFKIWYKDWIMIDPDFGADFLIRYRNIFNVERIQNYNIPDVLQLKDAIPRMATYVKNTVASYSPNKQQIVSFDSKAYEACTGVAILVQWNGYHNIYEVNETEYNNCTNTSGTEVVGFHSANYSETIDLNANVTQTRYFICQKHCNNGAKFKITCNIPQSEETPEIQANEGTPVMPEPEEPEVQANEGTPVMPEPEESNYVLTSHHSLVEKESADSYILTSRYRRILNTINVFNGISIDECRYKCFTDANCQHFNYEENEGVCTVGYGLYEQTKHLGDALLITDRYRLTYLKTDVLERVNRYYKRARMMQGRYSVLHELGINNILDKWQGYDWMVHREMGPSLFTTVPISDGSRSISMQCMTNNCARSSAIAFQKSEYTSKEANAICGSMDTGNCVVPCILDDDECKVISAYVEPKMYYMIDFSAPNINQQESYRMNQGRNAYNIILKWNYDNTKDFDSHSMNPEGRPMVVEGRKITFDIQNAEGIGGIRFLWTEEDGKGWVYKSRKAFNNYLVDQSHADRNLHRGGTCGASASEKCPGSKTYYDVPCNARGTCELSCECVCEKAPEEYYLDAIRIAGSAPDNPDGSSEDGVSALVNNPTKSPYRGTDCSIECPGYDGWSIKNICSGRGTCGDRGQCICDYGYIGDNCQFECPGFDQNNKYQSAEKICNKKGSCTLSDITADSFRISDIRNKKRFFNSLKTFYESCNEDKFKGTVKTWSTTCKTNISLCENGFKSFVGETCTTNSDCHSNKCDSFGTYHGCKNLCVQPNPEIFPSPKGILIDKEVRSGISQDWKDYNCPTDEDVWFDTMWLLVEGEIGHTKFNGITFEFYREEMDHRTDSSSKSTINYVEKNSLYEAQAWCDLDEFCYGVSATNNTNGKYAYWTPTSRPLYFRPLVGGKKIWIKNPFISKLNVFESTTTTEECNNLVDATSNDIYYLINTPYEQDSSGCKVYGDISKTGLSSVLYGKINGVCSVPNQQISETPWVSRPKVYSFIQRYDEAHDEYTIGGYPFTYNWGYDKETGLTTVRDLNPPTIVSQKECEILPNFELRCAVCDCFSDNIQGFWAGPMCTACKRGYATKTCKKICPGYDGKNDYTICSGNGVCNFGVEGTGRCMCGGKGGMASVQGVVTDLYKDQDYIPVSASREWCNTFNTASTCDLEPYCAWDGSVCVSVQLNPEERSAVEITYPKQHEYPYYFVKYRQFSTWVWPKKSFSYYRYESGYDLDTEGISRRDGSYGVYELASGFGPVPGYIGWHPDRNVATKHYYIKNKYQYSNDEVMNEFDNLFDAKTYCDTFYDCVGISNYVGNAYKPIKLTGLLSTNYFIYSNDPGYTFYFKTRNGEEGCIDFHRCGLDSVTPSLKPSEKLSSHVENMGEICPGTEEAGGDYAVGMARLDNRQQKPKYFGNSVYEGCCRCSGGLRGHGIPESMTRWLFSPGNNVCHNTYAINNKDDKIGLSLNPMNTYEENVTKICEYACTNGFPNIPDINLTFTNDNKENIVKRIYEGCCACSAETTDNIDGSFWNMRLSTQKSTRLISGNQFETTGDWKTWAATKASTKWWTPRSYKIENIASKVNMPPLFAHFKERLSFFKTNNYNECPFGDASLCENDCKLCQSDKTGYNCAGQCVQCLMGGTCDNTPAEDGSTKCTCVSDSLDPDGGCCPVGFSLILGNDILERENQINGIKAGLITFYERNRGKRFNGAASFYKSPESPHDDTTIGSTLEFAFAEDSATPESDSQYALTGYKYLKQDQIQSGCYPCPGMFTAVSICDKELEDNDICSEEDTELTQERMWTVTSRLSKEFKNEYNLWVLKVMDLQYRPQLYDFPFGYPRLTKGFNLYSYASGYSLKGVVLSGYDRNLPIGYETIEEAKTACDLDPNCKHIVNIPPTGATRWYENYGILSGTKLEPPFTSFPSNLNMEERKDYCIQINPEKKYDYVQYKEIDSTYKCIFYESDAIVVPMVGTQVALIQEKNVGYHYLFDNTKEVVNSVGYNLYSKLDEYKDPFPYMNEFSNMYVSGNSFSNACGGNRDYCQAVEFQGNNLLNEAGTNVFSYRLGCSICDVSNVYSIYTSKTDVGDLYPVPGYDLGFSFSSGCAKCLPGQGGPKAITQIRTYCYPSGCDNIDDKDMARWDNYGITISSDGTTNLTNLYKTNVQKQCIENGVEGLNTVCKNNNGDPKTLEELSWPPGKGCAYCNAGTGFAYDLNGNGTIDDSQFNSAITQHVNYPHVSDDISHAYGTVVKTAGHLFQTGRGQMDPYDFFSRDNVWPKNITCRPCPINSFSTERSNCKECPLGTTNQNEGSSTCSLCDLGQFFAIEKDIPGIKETKCVTCPPGMYQDEENKISLQNVVPFNWNDNTITAYGDLPNHAKGYGGCKKCKKGKFNPFWGQETCFDCPAGTKGFNGDIDSSTYISRTTIVTSCETCRFGEYQDIPGQTECKSCGPTSTKTYNIFEGDCKISKPDGDRSYCGDGTWRNYSKCICECDAGHRLIPNTEDSSKPMKCDSTYDPCLDTGGGHSTGSYGLYCLHDTECSVSNNKATCNCENTKSTNYEDCYYRRPKCPDFKGSIQTGNRCENLESHASCCGAPAPSPSSPAPSPSPATLPWWYWLGAGGLYGIRRRRLLNEHEITSDCIDDYKYYCSNALDKKHCYYKHLIHMPSCPKTVKKKTDIFKTYELHSQHSKFITYDNEEYEHIGNGTYHLRKPKLHSFSKNGNVNSAFNVNGGTATLVYQNRTQGISNIKYWYTSFNYTSYPYPPDYDSFATIKYSGSVDIGNEGAETFSRISNSFVEATSRDDYILPSWQQHNSIDDCRNVCLRGSYITYDTSNTSPHEFSATLFPNVANTEMIEHWEIVDIPSVPGNGPFHDDSGCNTNICQENMQGFDDTMNNPYKWSSSGENYDGSIILNFVPNAFNGHLLDVQSTSASCITCGVGKYTESDFASECLDCPVGKYNNLVEQPTDCVDCASGSYQNEKGKNICKTCPTGATSSQGSSALSDCVCPTGQQNAGGTCTACPAGKYSDDGSGACKTCSAGNGPNSARDGCEQCTAGKYGDGTNDCTDCDNDEGSNTGASSCSLCNDNWEDWNYGSCSATCCESGGERRDTRTNKITSCGDGARNVVCNGPYYGDCYRWTGQATCVDFKKACPSGFTEGPGGYWGWTTSGWSSDCSTTPGGTNCCIRCDRDCKRL